MTAQVSKSGKAKKIVLGIVISFFALVLITAAVLYGVFFNEINAVSSFRKVDDNVYYMEYDNNYYFDEFLETGASSDSELIAFMTKKLLKGLPIEMELPDFGCSTFTAATEEGDKLFSRNYDFDYSPILITKTNPKKGYKSIATTDLKALGFSLQQLPKGLMDKFICLAAPYAPFDGVNEKGVAISVNMVNGEPTEQDNGKIPFTTTTLIRLVLDKADNVEKAVELIGNYEMHDSTGGPFHFHIADKSGDSAVIEYVDNELKVTRQPDDADFFAMTNFLIYDGIGDDFGRDRYEIIQNRLTATGGVLSEAEAAVLLEDARMDITMWSNVFNLTDGTMTFYSYADFDHKLNFSVEHGRE